jgi:hypothetical protein
MQLRQATALHRARYRGGLHFAASLAAAQAGVKFAIAHNTPALSQPQKMKQALEKALTYIFTEVKKLLCFFNIQKAFS